MITTHIWTLGYARRWAWAMAQDFALPAVTIWTRTIQGAPRYCITPILGQPHPKPATWTPFESMRFHPPTPKD